MNGARTIFRRKGYLLTALAAAVLLAASSGTAWAQTTPAAGTVSIEFDRTSASFTEGASGRANPAATVKVTRTGTAGGLNLGQMVTLQVGMGMPAGASDEPLTIAAKGGTVGGSMTTTVADTATGATRNVDVVFTGDSAEVVLSISSETVDGDWADATYNLTLERPSADISLGRDVVVVTAMDANPQPVATFSRTNIKLTEASGTGLSIAIGTATGERRPAPADLTAVDEPLVLMVDPPDAFVDADMDGKYEDGPVVIEVEGDPIVPHTEAGRTTPTPGLFRLYKDAGQADAGNIGAIAETGLKIYIRARDDMSGYKSSMITISFYGKSLETDEGDITAGPALALHIESDEATPTVSFSPTDVTVDEGGSVETVLLAEGTFGSEVMEVTLSVEGDALVGLYQGMDKLEANAAGNIVIDLGTSNSARLTARSYSDRDLNDGDTKFIAWKITDADGANIGDGYWFRVDVMGSTAVPALPLLGQLLLALFLMAGGARLYRRRQG